MDGIINIYKERGFTSHDVVARLRGIFHQKRIGHTGTLDPDAVGVLPVCLGKATKVCGLLSDRDKSYRAVCQLGVETDTQDLTGTVLREMDHSGVTREQIEACLGEFRGEIWQTPPMYSARKVNGKRLYELAREGKVVERAPSKVHIFSLTLVDADLGSGCFTMDVTCSKGTYIRMLCHDIGKRLGCLGAMKALVRTRVSVFRIEDALTLAQVEECVREGGEAMCGMILPVDLLFPGYPAFQVRKESAGRLANGNPLPPGSLHKFCRDAGSLAHVRSDVLRDAVQGGPGGLPDEGSCSVQEGSDLLLDGGSCSVQEEPDMLLDGGMCLVYDENGVFRAIYQKRGRDLRVRTMF